MAGNPPGFPPGFPPGAGPGRPRPGVQPFNAGVPRAAVSLRDTIGAMDGPTRNLLANTRFLFNNYFEYHRRGVTALHAGGLYGANTPWLDAVNDPTGGRTVWPYANAVQCQRLNGPWESIYLDEPLPPAQAAMGLGPQGVGRYKYSQGGRGGGRGSAPVPPDAANRLQRRLAGEGIPIKVKRVFSAGGMVRNAPGGSYQNGEPGGGEIFLGLYLSREEVLICTL